MMTGSENRGERNQEGINSDRTWSRCDREVRYGIYSLAAGLLRQRCGDHRTVSSLWRQLTSKREAQQWAEEENSPLLPCPDS